jgi:hypothetical protein
MITYTAQPRLTLTHTTVLERSGRRCECTGSGCHGAQTRCPRALPTHVLIVAPADPSCPPALASRLSASQMRAWCGRCWDLAARQARAQRAAEGWQRLPIDYGDTGSVSLRLVVAVLAVLAMLGCLAARPHPVVAASAVVAVLGVLAALAVATWRERESEHRDQILYLDGDRDRLVAEIDASDLTIADLHVELDDLRVELDALRADAADAQESGPSVDDPGPYFRFSWPPESGQHAPHCADHGHVEHTWSTRECRISGDEIDGDLSVWGETRPDGALPDGALKVVLAAGCTLTLGGARELQAALGEVIHELQASQIIHLRASLDSRADGAVRLYEQCRELIDLTACQRSSLDEARAEIGRLRQALHTEAADVRRIVTVAAECRRLVDDEQTDRQVLVERLLEAIDGVTTSDALTRGDAS